MNSLYIIKAFFQHLTLHPLSQNHTKLIYTLL